LIRVPTHYEVLGIGIEATPDDIKRAYYRRARRLHPDAHVESAPKVRARADRAMSTINEAWQVLRDPDRRAAYDALLAEQARAIIHHDTSERARRRDQAKRRAAARARAARGVVDPADKEASVEPRAIGFGGGFRPWLGSSGLRLGPANKAGQRELCFALAVDGATDLTPLRRLAPDRLMALHAEKARFGDEQLAHLEGHMALKVIDLSASRVTDAGLLHIAHLPSLDTLMLWETGITDKGIEILSDCTSLRVLGLGNTAITDRGIAALARLTHLRVLQLWGTQVRGPGLRALDACENLELVSLPWRIRGRWRRHLRRAHPRLTLT
jgi:curved DNA-binding protein CbpA